MEKLTLTPQSREIIVNNGSIDGAVDLFSYGPESEESLRSLGSLYVVGHRDTDSSNMGYMASLIAALARREYYAQPGLAPKEAFTRTLRKINEVVEEFFKSSGMNLSVGIFAIAGGTILVSKLDKFKILLAREGEVIDILNNVMLFAKEHVERREFSSIISGSVQAGDRLLAYYPAKGVTTRERVLKGHLLKLSGDEFAAKIAAIGRDHASFATALLHVDMVQTAQQAAQAGMQPRELQQPQDESTPARKPMPPMDASLAWTPRQHMPASTPQEPAKKKNVERYQAPVAELTDTEPEVPHIISTEFALGTRQSSMSRMFGRLHLVRLDTRGKALFLSAAALLIVGGVLVAKSYLFVSPENQKAKQALLDIQNDVKNAQAKIAQHEEGEARQILVRSLTALNVSGLVGDKSAHDLTASIVQTMDTLDNAQDATLSLITTLDTDTDRILTIAWSSTSQSIWAVSADGDNALSAIQIRDGQVSGRTAMSDISPSAIIPFRSGVLVMDATAHKLVRVIDGKAKAFTLPTQETIFAAASYEGNLYIITDQSLLKVSDLDTDKPVTKQWLTTSADFVAGTARIFVDGSIWTLGLDGQLTNYYKGKKATSVLTTLRPSGTWEISGGTQETQLVLASTDTKRVHVFDTKTGELIRTLKLDSQQPFAQMTGGPDGSVLVVSKDNKIWKAQ